MGHKHGVRDTSAHFTIDQFTRQIKNDSAEKTTIVQYDHNSERLTFEMPLYVDGHAMTLCDLIEIHFINIATDGKMQNPGVYEVTDIKAEGEKAIFTWLVSQEATQFAGSLHFFIVFKCTENGVTVYRWGTEIFKNLAISDGMDNGEAVLTEYPDILAQWKAQLFDASDTAVVNVATAEASALAAIEAAGEAKKQSVLDSIPDEYEALSALADQNHRNKAGAIVLDAEGESIVVNDASEYPVQNLKVFGKSTQDGTPTPDAPVDIISVENAGVRVYGKNLLKNIAANSTSNGITFTVNEDGSVTVDGTATAGAWLNVSGKFTLPKGDYILSGCPDGGVYGSTYVLSATTAADYGNTKNFTIEEETEIVVNIGVYTGCTVNNLTFHPMIRLASIEDDAYEPYKELQTVATSHTLPGIPVSSGGNYTDENGQQWICDEVDFARGVYIQRVGTRILDGSEDEHWEATSVHYYVPILDKRNNRAEVENALVCSHFKVAAVINNSQGFVTETYWSGGNVNVLFNYDDGEGGLNNFVSRLQASPITIVYVLATPIETPLSDAEINAFKALHTNKPNTTILNDAGAFMAVEYVADTKTYIDNKIAKMIEEVTG